jgi:hypothetical protein
MFVMTIGVLESKQRELVEEMQDKSKTPTELMVLTMMYDDIKESIKVLNREFFRQ